MKKTNRETNKKQASTIKHCNVELLEEQKMSLKNDILYNENSNGFIVYDIEAGCRKTRTAEEALAELALKTDKQAIFVRLNNADCRESVRNINQMAGKEIAFAFNNEDLPTNTERIRTTKELPRYPIVVITHAKYKALAKNPAARKAFIKGRNVLVMDEFVSIRETVKITVPIINVFKQIFQTDVVIYSAFSDVVALLEDKLRASLSNNGRHLVRFEYGCLGKAFDHLLKLIRSNYTNEKVKERVGALISLGIKDIDYRFMSLEVETVKNLCEWMLNIKDFYKNICIIANGVGYTNNSRYTYWMLDNSIILDANGCFQIAYELNPTLYHLKQCEPVLNHKNWTIINVLMNTTTSSKESMTSYYDYIKKRLSGYQQDLLVICKKDEMDLLNETFCHTGYFGNIIGSNKWVDVKNIAIIHTPNLNDFEYILTFFYYNKEFIESHTNLMARKRGRKMVDQYEFTEPKFEKVRIHWIASEIYQAVKRVNRNMEYDSDCMIFINNDEVIGLLKEKLKNCTVKQEKVSDNEVGYVFTKQDRYIESLQNNSYASRFIQLLAELQNGLHKEIPCKNGVYKKKVIREYLGILNATSFSHHVLNKSSVIDYCKTRGIEITGQTIKLAS